MANVYKKCEYCGKDFKTTDYLLSINKSKLCSKDCRDKNQIGKKQAKEHIKKRIEKITGKKRKPFSNETILKMSIAKKGKKKTQTMKDKTRARMIGEKNPSWRGGISKNINEYENNRYKNLSEEKRKIVSWRKNKRNRLKNAVAKELGGHTYGEWELLKKQYNYTCPCCKLSEPFVGQKSESLTEDHIIPLSKGGSDLIENIQPLCLACNIKKHTRIIKY